MGSKPPGTPKATRAQVAERRTQAIELRQAGVDPVTIGRQLRYGTWRDNADGTTEQVSSDATLSRMVRQDIDRGLADRRLGLHTAAEELIRQSTERLERLRAAAWSRAIAGSAQHVRECRAIEAQLAQLNGWNKPVRHQVELPEAQRMARQAVDELLALAASDPSVDLRLTLPETAEVPAHG